MNERQKILSHVLKVSSKLGPLHARCKLAEVEVTTGLLYLHWHATLNHSSRILSAVQAN